MKKQLSVKRAKNAVECGAVYAKSFLKDYTDNPSFFPKGIDSLPVLAGRIAKVSLYLYCTWEPSKEEEELAEQTAIEFAQQAVDFAKKFKGN